MKNEIKGIQIFPWSSTCLYNKGILTCFHRFQRAHNCTVGSKVHNTSSTCPSPLHSSILPHILNHKHLPKEENKKKDKKSYNKPVNHLTRRNNERLYIHCQQYLYINGKSFILLGAQVVEESAMAYWRRKELKMNERRSKVTEADFIFLLLL